MVTKQLTSTQKKSPVSLERLTADRLLRAWRKKYAGKLKGLDAVRAIREFREGRMR